MTPEAQRIAIAEACGWKRDGEWEGFPRWITPKGERFGAKNDPLRCVPDYLNDLNAMHEAEKLLSTLDEMSKYFDELKTQDYSGWTYHATAAQRAERLSPKRIKHQCSQVFLNQKKFVSEQSTLGDRP